MGVDGLYRATVTEAIVRDLEKMVHTWNILDKITFYSTLVTKIAMIIRRSISTHRRS